MTGILHGVGLVLSAVLAFVAYWYWPLPIDPIQSLAPDFYKNVLRAYVRDYLDLIGFLVPFVVFSLANWGWRGVTRLVVGKDG
ncbi:MAG: hypothetical protein AAGF59_12660 [Pseudomonadota bacterium]